MNVAGGEAGAAATAVVLVGLLTLINLCARKAGPDSAEDAARMNACEPAAPAGITLDEVTVRYGAHLAIERAFFWQFRRGG